MSSENYHEPFEQLTERTREMHRAIESLREELEAVDWYSQRADVTKDPALKAILIHNRNEEVEHAMMILEWIRRHDEVFSRNAETYLFTKGEITEVEKTEGPEKAGAQQLGAKRAKQPPPQQTPAATFGSLGIGSLKGG
ncbi:MAG: encapsulin-associated ferritin-like protein [Polyangiales bacterium]